MTAHLARICRYPVKGMSAEDLARVALSAGRALPGDRRFAILRASAQADARRGEWMTKHHFVTLLNEARLAKLTTRFDAESGRLTIERGGKPVVRAQATDATGRMLIDQFFAAFLGTAGQGSPKLIDGGELAMTDEPEPLLSLVNLASVRDLQRVLGGEVDARRFRGNLMLDGLPAWAEMAWPGRSLAVGAARLQVVEPITRCAATTVNPDTAERDLNVPKALNRGYHHVCMGVYARVTTGGTVAVGDTVETAAAAPGGMDAVGR